LQPLGGESANHSAVNFLCPDVGPGGAHPLYAGAVSQVVTLRAGDALFLPEGWWHQVDSDGATIAVNYWRARALRVGAGDGMHARLCASDKLVLRVCVSCVCRWRSAFGESLGGDMDAYFARRACESLVAAEKARLLCEQPLCVATRSCSDVRFCPVQARMLDVVVPAALPGEDEDEAGAEEDAKRQRGDTAAAAAPPPLSRRERAAFATLRAAAARAAAPTAPADVEALFAALSPAALQRVLASLALDAPSELRRLLLSRLTPVAAELLTARLEAADAQRGGSAAEDGAGFFYGHFYGAFSGGSAEDGQRDDDDGDGDVCDEDGLSRLFGRLLDLKEALAAEALRRVIAAVLQPRAG
jgi:hypothetical protein